MYLKGRLKVEDNWPPDQPKDFIPLVLTHKEKGVTITELLNHLEQNDSSTILLVGLSGVGKSMFLKEVAYQWGARNLLKKFALVILVCLRNVNVEIKSLSDLIKCFCTEGESDDDTATQITVAASKYFSDDHSKYVALLLDGYDELCPEMKKEGLIVDILNRKVLRHCSLIISSRPHTTVSLRRYNLNPHIVEVLGFTVDKRDQYIKIALQNDDKVKKLLDYLQYHSTINSLSFNPFHLAVLVYLCNEDDSLPTDSAELYEFIICSNVSRYLAKLGGDPDDLVCYAELNDLPEPSKVIIQQLSKLSLNAVQRNKSTFTYAHIKEICPKCPPITPGTTNTGFGLLKAEKIGRSIQVSFVHNSIQEYLAAYSLHMQPDEELSFLKENFWNDTFSNLFTMYIEMTKTMRKEQRSSFINLLKDRDVKTSTKLLKYLHLFRCFKKIGENQMCTTIEEAFSSQVNFCATTLSPSDVESLSVLISKSSCSEWKKVNFFGSHIQDIGIKVLHRMLHTATIEVLDLQKNFLTSLVDSEISEIVIRCAVKELWIGFNPSAGETEDFCKMLSDPSSKLNLLAMKSNELSSTSIKRIFNNLQFMNNKLSNAKTANDDDKFQLDLAYNDIDDETCDVIISTLRGNRLLKLLGLSISATSAENLLAAFEDNTTLEILALPKYPEEIQHRLLQLVETINNKRSSQTKLVVKFKIFIY